MIYSPSTTAALGIVEDAQPEEPLTLRGEGLWVCLISSGKCVVSLSDLDLMPAGSALLLPPQNAAAGHLVLSRGPLTLAPENECHLLCVQLTGQAAEQFLAGLSEMPFLARGETCPAAAELYVDYICVKAVYGLWLFWEKLKGKNLNKTEQIFLIQ